MHDDDTFTFSEIRITLTAFMLWLNSIEWSDDDLPVDLVDRFIEASS